MPLGVHNSIAGGLFRAVERAVELGCDALQMFGRNPRSWAFKPVSGAEKELFRQKRKESGIYPVAVHTTYLINLCSPIDVIYDKSVYLFKKELETAESIGADYLVTHLGSAQEMGPEYALRRIIKVFKEVKSEGLGAKTMILLENTSGAGYGFGSRLVDIGEIIDGAKALGLDIGFCIDTCHAFAAGYALRDAKEAEGFVEAIDREAGLERLKLVHLNDSKGELGSKLDRHEHIGKGKIGLEGIGAFINHRKLKKVPLILETPKKIHQDDPQNLKTVRQLKGLK